MGLERTVESAEFGVLHQYYLALYAITALKSDQVKAEAALRRLCGLPAWSPACLPTMPTCLPAYLPTCPAYPALPTHHLPYPTYRTLIPTLGVLCVRSSSTPPLPQTSYAPSSVSNLTNQCLRPSTRLSPCSLQPRCA